MADIPADFLDAHTRQQAGLAALGLAPTEDGSGLGMLDRLRMTLSRAAGGNWSPDATAEASATASAAPPSVTPEAMELFGYAPLTAAKNALTEKGPASRPASRGPAGNRVGVAAPNAEFEALMKRKLASAEAEAGLLGKAAADTKVSDWANKRREFDKTNVLNVPDPMNSRAISDAMIAFGGKLLASEGRDVGGGVQEGGKAWMAGRNRNEDQASKERDFRLKSFMDTMGLEQKDVESLTAKDKAVLAAAISGIQAKDVDITSRLDYAKEGRKEAHELEKVDRQGQWTVRGHEAGKTPKEDPVALLERLGKKLGGVEAAIAAQGGKASPEQEFLRRGLHGLTKDDREPKAEKLDQAAYDASLARLSAMKVGKGKDPVPKAVQLEIAEGVGRGRLDPARIEEYVKARWPVQ